MANEYKNLNGITLSLPGRPSFTTTLIGLGLPDQSTTEVDDTDLSSTVKKSFAGPVLDCGELSVTIRFTPDIAIPIGQVDELIRVSLPLLNGQSTAGKYEFQGHISKMTAPKAANDGRSEVGITMQVNTKPVWTAGS